MDFVNCDFGDSEETEVRHARRPRSSLSTTLNVAPECHVITLCSLCVYRYLTPCSDFNNRSNRNGFMRIVASSYVLTLTYH